MGESARRAGCEPLGHDCCQTDGERAAPSLHQVVPPLAPLSSPLGWNVAAMAMAAESLLPEPSWEELESPALLQGIGLYTFLSVFLI
jgi:hypothetical protein